MQRRDQEKCHHQDPQCIPQESQGNRTLPVGTERPHAGIGRNENHDHIARVDGGGKYRFQAGKNEVIGPPAPGVLPQPGDQLPSRGQIGSEEQQPGGHCGQGGLPAATAQEQWGGYERCNFRHDGAGEGGAGPQRLAGGQCQRRQEQRHHAQRFNVSGGGNLHHRQR